MFNRFATGVLSWLQGVINKMLGSSTLQQALNRDLGLTIDLNPFMFAHLQKVTVMYFNQAEWLNEKVVSLNLAASIAGEIARAVTIEMDVEVSGSPRADFINEQVESLLPKMREQVFYLLIDKISTWTS